MKKITPFVKLPVRFSNFKAAAYKDSAGLEHLIVMHGDAVGKANVLLRIQSECLTGDVFTSRRCDCYDQLHFAMKAVQKGSAGLILYLRQEGRGHGLFNKIRAYTLQDQGMDTVESAHALGLPADARSYKVAAEILKLLRVKSVKLLTNNPRKITGLKKYHIKVSRSPLPVMATKYSRRYIETKRKKMGHL